MLSSSSSSSSSLSVVVSTSLRRRLNHLHASSSGAGGGGGGQYVTAQDSRLLHWRYGDFDDRNFQIHGQTLLYIFILFSIILLATLLLLYARWFFRLRHLPSSAAHSHSHLPQFIIPATAAAAASSAPPPPSSFKGMDRAAIDSIPIVLYNQFSKSKDVKNADADEDEYESSECCICLGVFEEGDKVKVLPSCLHRYHCECVDLWLCAHSSCPLCRVPVTVRIDNIDIDVDRRPV